MQATATENNKMKVQDRNRPELGNIVEWIKMREPEGEPSEGKVYPG